MTMFYTLLLESKKFYIKQQNRFYWKLVFIKVYTDGSILLKTGVNKSLYDESILLKTAVKLLIYLVYKLGSDKSDRNMTIGAF